MKSLVNASVEEIAYLVCTALHEDGITAVLTGGSAATFYAPEAYQTRDLDFVIYLGPSGHSTKPLLNLGFRPSKTRGIYEHPETPLTLEFPEGPLAVGADEIIAWSTYRKGDQILHVLSATDCVRDRLSAAIHWRDLSSARQAAEVAKLHPIDMQVVEDWCRREGGYSTFEVFKALLT